MNTNDLIDFLQELTDTIDLLDDLDNLLMEYMWPIGGGEKATNPRSNRLHLSALTIRDLIIHRLRDIIIQMTEAGKA